jgi:hypothetical protein
VDKNGKKTESIIDMTLAVGDAREHQTISFEARTVKEMLLRLYSFYISHISAPDRESLVLRAKSSSIKVLPADSLTSDCGEKKASEQRNDEYNSEIKLGFTHKQDAVDSKICL